MKMDTRLILALDLLASKEALSILNLLRDHLDAVKIGYPLILAAGLDIVTEVSSFMPVIADLKVADIPNTNKLICEQVLEAGAKGLIAHAFTGKDSLDACVRCAQDFGAELFVVTEMSHPGATEFMAPVAENLAMLAVDAGASGVVAPATRPERIRLIRSIIGDMTIISPGVGAQGGAAREAIEAGADYLIVGRSIIDAKDPVEVVEGIMAEMD